MNRNLRNFTALAAACLALTAAHAAGDAVNTMGAPTYFVKYQNFTKVGGLAGSETLSNLDATGGTVGVSSVIGPLWNSLPALQQAVVTNDGATYWARASGPTLDSPVTADTVVGAFSSVNIYQSFTKTSEDAQLRFTYTGALLQSFRDPERRPTCDVDGINCTYSQIRWEVTVRSNSDDSVVLMVEEGEASMFALEGVFHFNASQYALDGTPVNPLWTWDCARCGLPALGLAEATLQVPFTGIVDLSAIPFDPTLEEQPEFTVHFRLLATAVSETEWVGATAWARDPLDLGSDAGVGFTVQDLQPTNNPVAVVPEPGTWALMSLGLLGMAGWTGRRRADRGAC